MATKYFLGTADAAAQVSTGSIDSVDGTPANNTFTVTIGGYAISAVGDTDVATTAAALVASLNASTHPYFAAITWTNPSAGNITGTADTAGVPFIAALTETGAGTGAVTDFSDDTANSGPNDWGTGANWSDGSIPANSDTVIIQDTAVNILWGLDQNGVDLTKLTIAKSYTGKIGLDYRVFTTSGALATSTLATEYRQTYLKIGITTLNIGENFGQDNPAGSSRIMVDLDTTQSTVNVFGTASSSSETGRAAVRLLGNHASNELYVRSGQGGVGVATGEPNETSTFSLVSISDQGSSSKVHIGAGVTLTTFKQDGGINVMERSSGTLTTCTVNGGTLQCEGSFVITTTNVNGGTLTSNHISGTVPHTTLNINNGGTVVGTNNNDARTWTTVNLDNGATLISDSDVVTITTLNEPSGAFTLAT